MAEAAENMTEYLTARYEFYQSDTHVTVVVWLDGVQDGEQKVSVQDEHFLFIVEKSDSTKYRVEFDLAHPVGVGNFSTKISAKKVEIKIPKRDCLTWTKLEKVSGAEVQPKVIPVVSTADKEDKNGSADKPTTAGPPNYPSSSKKASNWSAFEKQVEAEEAEEKPQDEAALNALFQKIYADADDDTKRAMMKSFVESNGTVLSTDWTKVGRKEVKTKAPSGMEFRKWQQ